MRTKTRFCELTKIAIKSRIKVKNKRTCIAATIELGPENIVRVVALSEVPGMSRSSLLKELLDCALGDAHDSFLSAYTDSDERQQANKHLKGRVKEFLIGSRRRILEGEGGESCL